MNIILHETKKRRILLKILVWFHFCVSHEIRCLINRSMIYFLLFDPGLISCPLLFPDQFSIVMPKQEIGQKILTDMHIPEYEGTFQN